MPRKSARKKPTKKKAAKRKYTKNPSLYPATFDEVISALVRPKQERSTE